MRVCGLPSAIPDNLAPHTSCTLRESNPAPFHHLGGAIYPIKLKALFVDPEGVANNFIIYFSIPQFIIIFVYGNKKNI